MTTARSIVGDALRLINRLSPGETLDADTAADCLAGLNSIADEINGSGAFLWREILTTSSALNSVTATLGTHWTGITSGTKILGATVDSGGDVMLSQLTMEQYHGMVEKATTGAPAYFAHDGAATVYFYPVPTGQTVKIRTRQVMSAFADLDTDYEMPAGYRAHLAGLLAERVSPVLSPEMLGHAVRAADRARSALRARGVNPSIICDTRRPYGRERIINGW